MKRDTNIATTCRLVLELVKRPDAMRRWLRSAGDPDLVLMLDSTMIRAHQHSAGQKNSTPAQEQLGRSRGGVSTKIHVAVDGLGSQLRSF